jgi:hypothetical protein
MSIDKSSNEWFFFRRRRSALRYGRFMMDMYRKQVITENDAYPGFSEKLRLLAIEIIEQRWEVSDLQKALQILAVVGTKDDIPLIQSLKEINDSNLDIDLQTCIYEIEHQ